jgi:hypothetical protein
MTTQKVTLSLNPETFKKFEKLAHMQGFSISGYVSAQMQKEIDKQDIAKPIADLLRSQYSNLTGEMSDKKILNDIVTILLARKIHYKAYEKLHAALDNIK